MRYVNYVLLTYCLITMIVSSESLILLQTFCKCIICVIYKNNIKRSYSEVDKMKLKEHFIT